MIARIDGSPGFAIHRTYLLPGGRGKAPISPVKMMLGSSRGGAVQLSDGKEALVIAEGIESGLSLLCHPLSDKVSVMAALSASGMANLHLPEQPSQLIIATDGDEAGRRAGDQLANRARSLGWSVTMLPAPDGKDWNDVLQEMKGNK